MVFDVQCPLVEGLPHRAETGGPLQTDPLSLREVSCQGDPFPNTESRGVGRFHSLHLEIHPDIFQGNAAPVGHAHHGHDGSSGPRRYRKVLRGRNYHVGRGVRDAADHRPGTALTGGNADDGQAGVGVDHDGGNVWLQLLGHGRFSLSRR